MCIVYIEVCTVHSVHCTEYILNCKLYSIQCSAHSVQWTVYCSHCTVCYEPECSCSLHGHGASGFSKRQPNYESIAFIVWLPDWLYLSWQSVTLLTISYYLYSVQLSWQSVTFLRVCNFLDNKQLSWQCATILTACDSMNIPWFVPYRPLFNVHVENPIITPFL